jgi:hypothetical protein
MSARWWVWSVALAFVAQGALADNAKPRGGTSGSSSASAGSRHPSSSSSGGRSSGSSTSSSSSSSGSSQASSSDSDRRHPRPGTGSGYGYRAYRPYRYGYGYGYYSSPYYYPYSDYYGYWGAPYYSGYGYYGRPYGYRTSNAGAIRVQVDPSEARVYVDGYYAGIVDDFDGIFQRLYLAPGRHELTLKLEGYRTHRVKLYVPYDHTAKFHYDMVKGTGGESVEDLVGPVDRDRDADRAYSRDRGNQRDDRDEADDDDDSDGDDDRDAARPSAREDDRDSRRGDRSSGALHLSIRPEDASVYVDGQFRGSGRQARAIEVSAGRHQIEVVRPGFKTFERQVEVKAGEPLEIDAELERP